MQTATKLGAAVEVEHLATKDTTARLPLPGQVMKSDICENTSWDTV